MRYWETDRYFEEEQFQELLRDYEQGLNGGSVPYLDADDMADVAEYYYAQHEDAKAKEAIQKALELHPDSVILQTYLVRECLNQDRWDDAERLLDSIDDIDNDREVMYLRAETLFHRKRYDKARRLLAEYFPADDSLKDQRMYAKEVIGLLLDYDGEEITAMLNEWGQRLEAMPSKTVDEKMMLADMYSYLGQHQKAIDTLTTIIDDDPYNKQAWLLMTNVKLRAGLNDEGTEAAEYAMAIDDRDLRLIMSRTWMYALKYNDLVQKKSDDEEELKRLHDECLSGIEWAKKCGLDNTDEYLLTTADILSYIDEPLMAVKYLKRDLKTHPDSTETMYMLGLAYIDIQNFEMATRFLTQAVERDPKNYNSDALPPLAYCQFQLGDYRKCLEYLDKAGKLNPESTVYYFQTIFPYAMPGDYGLLIRRHYLPRH